MPLKALAQLFAAVLLAVIPLLTPGALTWSEWVNVGITGAGAVNVYLMTNFEAGAFKYAKALTSAICAVGVLLVSLLSDGGLHTDEVIQLIIAGVTPLGVALGVRDSGQVTPTTTPRHAA